ncbi:uncharacterized protein DUF4917 [Kribbella steppae]|uniref:Uncharacterized protein DUF4917 n=2 Tax=Kribbella steppae TaxID=2512223 RepID=A0A4R2HQ59_9ACTN|nr:uncharacterized protein DUF4917 [Kribbella steppae]
MRTTTVDDELPDWSTLDNREWPTLIIGNGLSINLWSDFRYDSLFSKAMLSSEAADIFAELDTTNFETALECIHHARLVLEALRRRTNQVDTVYAEVRDALFEAVTDAHLKWSRFPVNSHKQIAETLDEYESVYTTNYDLCLYWSHLQNRARVDIVDYFWSQPDNRFDPADVTLRSPRLTPVYYLHGAVHLWQDDENDNGKWTNADGGNLLSLASNYTAKSSRRPLFVSEGTSRAKVRTIQRSPYLSFCLESLADDEQDAVIFGHSLSAQDQHIVDAINAGPKRKVAVSIYPSGNPQKVIEEKVRIQQALDRHRVSFYDSTTHPLGDPGLNIP